MISQLEELVSWVKEKGSTRVGLLLGFALPFVIMGQLPEYASDARVYWAGVLILEVVVVSLWFYLRTGGVTRNKLRFVIAIYSDREELRKEIEADFVQELVNLVNNGELARSIKIIKASAHESRDCFANEGMVRIADVKRAHYLLAGRVRTRTEGGEDHHYVELRALVRVAEMEERLQHLFREDMNSVFPNKMIKIPKTEQLPQMRITAQWLGCASRYIIALASVVSGDAAYAKRLLEDAESAVENISSRIPQRNSMRNRIRSLRGDCLMLLARQSYASWRKTRSHEDLRLIRGNLDAASKISSFPPEIAHLKAQVVFLENFDARQAEAIIRAANLQHPVANANLAFLLAWQGQFGAAAKRYAACGRAPLEADLLNQIYTFFDWLGQKRDDMLPVLRWCEVSLLISQGDLGRAERVLLILKGRHVGIDESEILLLSNRLATAKKIVELQKTVPNQKTVPE